MNANHNEIDFEINRLRGCCEDYRASIDRFTSELTAANETVGRLREVLKDAPHWQRCKKLNCACKPDSLWQRLVCPACPCDCYKSAALSDTPPVPKPKCGMCKGTGWVQGSGAYGNGGSVPCPDCQPTKEKA